MMHRTLLPIIVLALALGACSGGTDAPPPTASSTPPPATTAAAPRATTAATVAPRPASAVPTLTTGPQAGVQIVTVTGARPGETATVTARAPAGVVCDIDYQTPAGTRGTATGLTTRLVSASGTVMWSWVIAAATRPGTGRVTVNCEVGGSDSAAIPIG